ncbi:MAG TPA: DUF1579 family protein [Usitatibacter sp.]|nr:DUF1579 family protein [Usitatibacter sp.]
MFRALAAATFTFSALFAHAQGQPTYACDSPESKQLDFWVGEWEATYAGPNNTVGKSRNRITKIMDGCVVLEEFSGAPGTKLNGHSVSTFDRASRQWKQAWVDNTASYLDFTGVFAEGRMTFAREIERQGKKVRQRMVFQDIRPESFKWLWQGSNDNGATWTTQWEIDYRRVK